MNIENIIKFYPRKDGFKVKISVLIALLAFCLIFILLFYLKKERFTYANKKILHSLQNQQFNLNNNECNKLPPVNTLKQNSNWDNLEALAEDEEKEFHEMALNHITRYLKWGKIDEEHLFQFRNTMLRLGDKAIVKYTNDLYNLNSSDISSLVQSEEAVQKTDFLLYMLMANRPLALDGVKRLALRPLAVDANGKISKSVHTFITFEAFQNLSAIKPELTEAYINKIERARQKDYIYHYYIGRQLAGVKSENIIKELKLKFNLDF